MNVCFIRSQLQILFPSKLMNHIKATSFSVEGKIHIFWHMSCSHKFCRELQTQREKCMGLQYPTHGNGKEYKYLCSSFLFPH
jgi:hypothetical protein